MKKRIISITVSSVMLFLISCNCMASESVSLTKIGNTSIQKTLDRNTDGYDLTSFDIEGVRINLSQEDTIKAKNFNLSKSDYAKYLYIMKYTKRGFYTEKLDPVITLGIESKTDEDRLKFAKIYNKQMIERQEAELRFAGIVDQVQDMMYPKNPGVIKSQSTGKNRKIVFLEPSSCLQSTYCKSTISNLINNKLPHERFDIFFVNSTPSDKSRFIHEMEKTNYANVKQVSFHIENGELGKFSHPNIPFYLIDNDGNKKVVSF